MESLLHLLMKVLYSPQINNEHQVSYEFNGDIITATVNGETDKMVILLRSDGENYVCETGLAPLSEIANGVKKLPEDCINEDGLGPIGWWD